MDHGNGMPAAVNLDIDDGHLHKIVVAVPVADADGVVALDVRCRLEAATKTDRLAIRPYPSEMEEEVARDDGRLFFLRPIVPEDEPILMQSFSRLHPEDIRMRFFAYMKTLPHRYAARLCQIDYDREMALALTEHGPAGTVPIHAVVRLFADPDNATAEFAIVVDPEVRGEGLGEFLMRRLIRHAKARCVGELFGEVLSENRPMRRLCAKLGFVAAIQPGDPGVLRMTLNLAEYKEE